jgi:signal transduction histidine kinase
MERSAGAVCIELRSYRQLLLVGMAFYALWWGVVDVFLPHAFNPVLGRALVVGAGVSVVGATFVSGWAARHVAALFAAILWLATAHYFYLVHGNAADAVWLSGALVTIAVASVLLSSRALVVYTVFAMGLALFAALTSRPLERTIFLPSVVTILLLSNMMARHRARAEREALSAEHARQESTRLEEEGRFKSRILSVVSHELLTPLQSIRLNCEAMQRWPEADASTHSKRMAAVSRSVLRLTGLIESLLSYARFERGEVEVRHEEVDLAAVLSEAVERALPAARAKHLDLRLSVEPDVGRIRSDASLIRSLVTQLVSNAIEYTAAGSVELTAAEAAGGHAISVRDTGCGVPAEQQSAINEPFTFLEPTQRKHRPGIGLGLALVKEIADALRATFTVASTVGVGSTFTVVLPRMPPLPRRGCGAAEKG